MRIGNRVSRVWGLSQRTALMLTTGRRVVGIRGVRGDRVAWYLELDIDCCHDVTILPTGVRLVRERCRLMR